jgi:hypothetical protein
MEELMHSSKDLHLICSYSIGFWKQCYHNHVRRVEHPLLDASVNASAPCRTARRDDSAGVVWVDTLNMGINADGESEFDRVERKRGRSK